MLQSRMARYITLVVLLATSALVVFLMSRGQRTSGTNATQRSQPFRIGALTESWGPTPHIIGLRDGGTDKPEPVPGEAARPDRVLWGRFRASLNGEPIDQEGRLQQVPEPERPDSRDQCQQPLLAEDVCGLAQATIPAPERLPGSESDPAIHGAARPEGDGGSAGVLPHRPAGGHPRPVVW